MIGIAFLVFVLMVFAFGYLKGRDSLVDEMDELAVYTRSVEAANRVTSQAWETAKAMYAVAADPSSRRGLPPVR
jgi:hypothetical protein